MEKVLKSFNTWAFKREQPGGADRLVQVVGQAIQTATPLSFVLYWGKGPRTNIAAPDIACLDFLKGMVDRIGQAHASGASLRLIFTDTHARLNGHAQDAVNRYFAEVEGAASARGFETAHLAEIVNLAQDRADVTVADVPSDDVLRSLVACAEKWYRGVGSIEQGARDYYRMNMVEKRAVETAFPESVFVTFNGSEFRDLFPAAMPIFYMYSLRRGVGVKPWFMAADETQVLAS